MKLFLIFCMAISLVFLKAQTNTSKNYKKHPYWIEMIKDPNVNYFESVNAYEEFWKNKQKPKEENEVIGQAKAANAVENKMDRSIGEKEKRKEKEMYKKYGLECKKFEHWKMRVKPYIQADGHILTSDEQLKMWEQK